ncbi:MAG TPA: LamG domain-containing protein, partial [Thermoplasmata archaeon]|nr:LamG domain-containing protein [Thermoplasmata archaeon]
VKDSSGNLNHGIAKNNAIIINHTTQPFNTIHNNSGFFNVLRDAYVRVPSSWSLNISKTITVEAWMKPQLLPPIIDIVDLEEKFGYTPYIAHASGDCYAIVSEDQSKRGTLQTVRISTDGNITSLNTTNFGDAKTSIALRPTIIKMTEKMFLIAYNSRYQNSNELYVHLRTYNISTNGSIEYTGNELALQDYASSTPNRPSLQKITGDIYAIAYWIPSQGGILKTLNISSYGQFNASSIKMMQYDAVSGYEPCIVNVSDNVIALAYRGALDHGILKTFNITLTGDITYRGDRVEFDSIAGFEPCLLQISGKVHAIAYRNTDKNGYVKTFNISSDGSITSTGNMMTFEDTVPCFDPCIIHGDQDFYVIDYATGNSGSTTGYITTIKIGKTGSITTQTEARREFKINGRDRCYNPIILHITEHLFAISFTGPTDHPGELITINIGMDTYPPHRGITKQESYGIYANTTTVVGSINNIMVSAPISPGWHYFAITYDSVFIRLYINASLAGSILYPNHLINQTPADLLFGRNYYGYIDEIAIYDQPLTQTQLQNHFINRGTFERYT